MDKINEARHISLDIETLATSENAVVTSIGVCLFDPEKLEIRNNPWHKIQWNISEEGIQDQIDKGREINYSTITWWLKQSKEAIDKTFFVEKSRSIEDALYEFKKFCSETVSGVPVEPSKVYIWGNGNMFDNCIMRSLFKTYGIEYPCSYRNDLDLRTIKWLMGKNLPKIEKEGTGHNAVDDAVFQAKLLNACLRQVKIND